MKALLGSLLVFSTLLLPACASAPPHSSPGPGFSSLNINSVAVGPIAYATFQPNEQCTAFIDDVTFSQ